MRVRALGPIVAVDADGTAHQLTSRSQRLVLALLAAQHGVVVAVDRLVDALWDEAPATATQTLRTYVSRLRRVLGDAIAIHPGGYALVCAPEEVDLARFEGLVRRARALPPADAVAALDEALGLWRGPAFDDLGGHEALRGTAVRLDDLRLSAREARAQARGAAGRADEAVAEAEELVADAPLREGAWIALIDGLRAAERTADGLRAYQRAVAALADAGLEPSAALRAAEAAVLAATAAPRPSSATAAPAVGPPPPQAPRSSLVGRAADLAGIADLLTRARLVTLVGPGGVGKTRLARAVAEHAERPVGIVTLARLAEPDQVAAAVADVIGGGEGGAALARAGEVPMLVVLDNAEHLIDEVARVADRLLSGGDALSVLVTSRERLGIDGEHVWPVVPLPVGGADPPARELFVQRLRALDPQRRLTEDDLAAVDRITARLDGLPLALEMAAARATTMPLAELADRLHQQLDLLRAPQRAVEPRHRTLGALVAWSEALLDPDERDLLEDLTVLAGPAPADDIQAITGRPDALTLLGSLAERSMVVADPSGEVARFGLLATIREHTRRRLDPPRAHDLARRHAEHLTAVAVACDEGLRTADEGRWRRRLETLTDEVRAAHRWARQHDPSVAARLSTALHLFSLSTLRTETLGWATDLVEALERAGAHDGLAALEPSAAGGLLASAAVDAAHRGDPDRAEARARRGAELGAGTPGGGLALIALGDLQLYQGDLSGAAETARQGVALANRIHDPYLGSELTAAVALAHAYAGDVGAAAVDLVGLRPRTPSASPSARAWLAYAEGEILLDRDPERALAALGEAARLAHSVGNRYVGGVALVSVCSLRARVGDPWDPETTATFRHVIDRWRREHTMGYQVTTLRNLVELVRRRGDAAEVAELVAAVDDRGFATYGEEAARLAAAAAWAEDELGLAAFAAHTAAGRARTIDEAARRALDQLAR